MAQKRKFFLSLEELEKEMQEEAQSCSSPPARIKPACHSPPKRSLTAKLSSDTDRTPKLCTRAESKDNDEFLEDTHLLVRKKAIQTSLQLRQVSPSPSQTSMMLLSQQAAPTDSSSSVTGGDQVSSLHTKEKQEAASFDASFEHGVSQEGTVWNTTTTLLFTNQTAAIAPITEPTSESMNGSISEPMNRLEETDEIAIIHIPKPEPVVVDLTCDSSQEDINDGRELITKPLYYSSTIVTQFRSESSSTKVEQADNTKKLFDGVHAVVVCLGVDMGRKRVEILENQLKLRGGSLVHETLQIITHVLVSMQVKQQALRTALQPFRHLPLPYGLCIVTPDWVTECIRTGQRLNESDFSWKDSQTEDHSPPCEHHSEDIKSVKPEPVPDPILSAYNIITSSTDTFVKNEFMSVSVQSESVKIEASSSTQTHTNVKSEDGGSSISVGVEACSVKYEPNDILIPIIISSDEEEFIKQASDIDALSITSSDEDTDENSDKNFFKKLVNSRNLQKYKIRFLLKQKRKAMDLQRAETAKSVSSVKTVARVQSEADPVIQHDAWVRPKRRKTDDSPQRSDDVPLAAWHDAKVEVKHEQAGSTIESGKMDQVGTAETSSSVSGADSHVKSEGELRSDKGKIKIIREYDSEDELKFRKKLESGNLTDDESKKLRKPRDTRPYLDRVKHKFACQRRTLITNLNEHLTQELERLQNIYELQGDKWRGYAYKKAVSLLRTLPYKVETVDQIRHIRGLGKKLADKIEELLSTGHTRRLQFLENDERVTVVNLFASIWGVGGTTANKWYSEGYRTLEQLRKDQDWLLNDAQRIGLKYIDDFQKRIPRDEVTSVVAIVEKAAADIIPKDVLELMCGGSYRRGKKNSGDVDILITRKDGKNVTGKLQELVTRLHEIGLITDDLSSPTGRNRHHSELYMGVYYLPEVGIHRRIDLKAYPYCEWPFATLYFTGNDHFNRSMRLFAKKKGLSLSDHNLLQAVRVNKEKIWEGMPIPCRTEEDIFAALGLEYVPPEERNCGES
eukprot:GILK01011569.1.p1 GENE.GILK01011569.1~~GILK01011569.1.p1  ORF type:complete len:1020 (-),score=203.03 GILK01011569.1:102-3161(-)